MPNKVFLAVLASLGCRSARTALNSGNAVFLAKPGPKDDLPEKIRAALEVHAGWAQAVAALRLSELGRAMEECLLAAQGGDASKLLALFPLAAGDLSGAVALAGQDWGPARMQAGSIATYVASPKGVSKSVFFMKLAASMGEGGSTSKNFASLAKILELGKRIQVRPN